MLARILELGAHRTTSFLDGLTSTVPKVMVGERLRLARTQAANRQGAVIKVLRCMIEWKLWLLIWVRKDDESYLFERVWGKPDVAVEGRTGCTGKYMKELLDSPLLNLP